MFLLLLMSLGAASVKAQVRIGGNTAPNPAVVLDLNTNNNANPAGNKGLGLPRVSLANDTTMLTPGVANLNGMIVCNTTNTLGGVGLYYWSTNSAKWLKVNLPPTSAADSGNFLVSNGSTWTSSPLNYYIDYTLVDTFAPLTRNTPVTWSLLFDSIFTLNHKMTKFAYYKIVVPSVYYNDMCVSVGGGTSTSGLHLLSGPGMLWYWDDMFRQLPVGSSFRIRCYRPSV